jgi:hypothetical protein
MNADIARWIVDRYNAWQKISLDDEVVSQEDEDWKKELEEEAFRRLQEVIQLGSLLRADHQRVDGKLGKDGLSCLCYLNVFSRAVILTSITCALFQCPASISILMSLSLIVCQI